MEEEMKDHWLVCVAFSIK